MKLPAVIVTFPVFFLGLAIPYGSAQSYGSRARELENKIYAARKLSEQYQRQYSWESRTDVTREGKVVDILIQGFRYGPDGKIEQKVLNEQEAKLPSSFLIHKLAEDMKEKLVVFLNGMHGFLQGYALDDAAKGELFFTKAMIGDPDPEGLILVSAENVITAGDKVTWWVDAHTYAIVRASVTTLFEGDRVQFSATYKYIPPGLQYMAFAEILVPEKDIMVQLHAYDYMHVD